MRRSPSPSFRPRDSRSAVRRAARTRRRRAAAALVVIGGVAGVAGALDGADGAETVDLRTFRPAAEPAVLQVAAGDRRLAALPVQRYLVDGRPSRRRLRRILDRVIPDTATVRSGRARITFRYDLERTVGRALALGAAGGAIDAVRRVASTAVPAPVVRQELRNTCESAALSVLLSTIGRSVSQRRLQAAFPRSGPLDPRPTASGRVWGDPDRGYVGRPDGGGAAGGFGIYPRPVRATARRFGASLEDLSGGQAADVYDRLRQGRAVMVWVGLSSGPLGKWTSPDGRPIEVNFGEHTVVLHGIRPSGALLVSNPLEGTREIWSQQRFELLWRRLGRRALTT